MLKKVLSAAILLLLVAFVGCKKDTEPKGPVTLQMWSFTDELEPVIERFEEQNPDVTINLTIVPNEDYLNKLKPVLRSGTNAPDIFTAEMSNVKEIVASGFWDVLNEDPYNADVSPLMDYQVEMASDVDGNVRGISWQTTPGGFFFRRSFAKEYLGTDDPAEVGEMINSQEKFLEVARTIKEESGGDVKMIPGLGDYNRYPLSARKNPFIDKNNQLHIDDEPVLLEFFDIAKTMEDEELHGNID
ncbi:MAG: ABC transporter substrate-binding protein, partial [Spirochaetota bacterium]